MAKWVDISYLEPASDEEDNAIEPSCYVEPPGLYLLSEGSTRNFNYHQDHNTENLAGPAPEKERTCLTNGFEIPEPELSAAEALLASTTQDHGCQHLYNISEPQNTVEEIPLHAKLRRKQTKADQKLDDLSIHGIAFRITSADDITVTIPSSYEEETPILCTADTESAQNPLPYKFPDFHDVYELVGKHVNTHSASSKIEEPNNPQDTPLSSDIETEDTFQELTPLIITTHTDERLIFFAVSEEGFDRVLAASYALDEVQLVDEILGATNDEHEDYWVEFEHEDQYYHDSAESFNDSFGADDNTDAAIDEARLAAYLEQQRLNTEDLDMYGSTTTNIHHDFNDSETTGYPTCLSDNPYSGENAWFIAQLEECNRDWNLEHQYLSSYESSPSEFDFEVDIPLSEFQALPIGPFASQCPPSPARSQPIFHHHHHHHPHPLISILPTTNTADINQDRATLKFMQRISKETGVPVPLGRRVYEVIGVVEEDRRGLRASRKYRAWFGREGWGRSMLGWEMERGTGMGRGRCTERSEWGLVVR